MLGGALLMLVATALLVSAFFLSSVYLQHRRGFSALRTGLVFLPVAVATALGALLAAHLLGRIGGRATAAGGMAVAAAGVAPLGRLDGGTGVYSVLLPGLSVAALGIGAVFVTAITMAMAMVETAESGLASAVVNTFHEVGGSIGVAVVIAVAAGGIAHGVPGGFAHAFTVADAAAAAVLAIGLIPPTRPKMTGGPHGHH